MRSSLLSVSYLEHQNIRIAAMLFFLTSRIIIVQSFHATFCSRSEEQRKEDVLMPSCRLCQDSIVPKITHPTRHFAPISLYLPETESKRNSNDSTALFATSFSNTGLSPSDQEDEKTIEQDIRTNPQNEQFLDAEKIDNFQI